MDYKIDLHVHSNTNVHAFSTIKENADYAAETGMKVIAITNHGPALEDTPHWWQLINIRIVPDYINGVRILKGVEANIVGENGELDINQKIYEQMEIILAGFHGNHLYPKNQDREKNTRAVINLMKSQKADIIVHLGNPEFPIDYREAAKTAKEYNIALELNNSSLGGTRIGSEKTCRELAKYAKEFGCYLCINTDSHYCAQIGHTPLAGEIAEEINYPEELILNSSEEVLYKFLEMRKSLRPEKIEDKYIETYFPAGKKGNKVD